MQLIYLVALFFFFNDTATTEIYTLSLHDALPIWFNSSLCRQPSHEFEIVCGLRKNRVSKPPFARPLGDSRAKIDDSPTGVPTVVFQLHDGSHGATRNNSPFALFHFGDFYDLAIHQTRDRPDSDRIANLINVAPFGGFIVIGVIRRREHSKLQRRPALAVKIDGVSGIKVDPERHALRFPSETLDFRAEKRRRSLLVIAAQTPDAFLIAIGNGHDARLMRCKINLKRQFIPFAVSIEIIDLRWKLLRL